MPLPLLFLVLPLTEIAVFILVGRLIGVGWTMALVLGTAILGAALLRRQGLGLLAAIRTELEAGRVPGRQLVHGVMVLVAGLLLMTPGFVTDTLGFLLFVPKVRDAGWGLLRRVLGARVAGAAGPLGAAAARGFGGRPGPFAGPGTPGTGAGRARPVVPAVVDLDADEFARQSGPGSPWRDGPAPDRP